MTTNAAAAIAQTPAASPSMPSEKLTTFMISTIPSTVSGTPSVAELDAARRTGA